MSRDASMVIERALTLAAPAAVVIGTLVGDGAEKANKRPVGVFVIGGSAITAGAGYAGPFVAVFF
jgi:hypothetical protein